ncbi:MAG: type II toxin-antitoxin system prevent-host-death family antitoxin [Nitrospiraceae bacterium]|nr:type II toxin-antitoxin system prevent-host-death family antitoxin [Nitrospiraceae bacterium]
MTIVGVRDLKNQLPKYLSMVKKGGQVIVTDRGKPIAIIHDLTGIETNASQNEILASLASAGKVRLPVRTGGVKRFDGVSIKGKSITDTVLENRR